MVRLYGEKPYSIVLVHGGPGAIGSLRGFANELNERTGVGIVEAIQSKYSIAELIEELYHQIIDNCEEKVTLIGHSWGAWLVALLAEKHPELVEKIILVGCAPLKDIYVADIGIKRLANLSGEQAILFQRLIENQMTDEDMKKIPAVFEKSDNYCLKDKALHGVDKTDSEMHNMVWKEAAKLRTSGELIEVFKRIRSKIYLIQGSYDPHPVNGVVKPLQENSISCETYILEKCGHSPFMEKYAKDEFYSVLEQIIF